MTGSQRDINAPESYANEVEMAEPGQLLKSQVHNLFSINLSCMVPISQITVIGTPFVNQVIA